MKSSFINVNWGALLLSINISLEPNSLLHYSPLPLKFQRSFIWKSVFCKPKPNNHILTETCVLSSSFPSTLGLVSPIPLVTKFCTTFPNSRLNFLEKRWSLKLYLLTQWLFQATYYGILLLLCSSIDHNEQHRKIWQRTNDVVENCGQRCRDTKIF